MARVVAPPSLLLVEGRGAAVAADGLTDGDSDAEAALEEMILMGITAPRRAVPSSEDVASA